MPRQSCPCHRGQPTRPVLARPDPLLAPPATVRAADLPTRRYSNPIPAAASPALCEALCLLRQQNALLTDILAAINSLTAATLATRQ